MGIRETLNRNPSITTGVTIGIIVVALIAIIWQAVASRPSFDAPRAFFTVDDGKTWFIDDAYKTVPFDHNGQQAVRAHIFKCPKSKDFAGYLERLTPESAKKIEENRKKGPNEEDPMLQQQLMTTSVEIKKPGGAKWFPRNSNDAEKIMNEVKCPDGSATDIEPVLAED